mgnify:FL=1
MTGVQTCALPICKAVTDVITDFQRNALRGAFCYACAPSGTGSCDDVGLFPLAQDRLKMALTLAHAAANALGLVNFSNLPVVPVRPDGGGGARFSAHHAAHTLVHIEHRQVILHGNDIEVACVHAKFTANTAYPAVIRHSYAFLCRLAQKTDRQVHRLHFQHRLGASGDTLAAASAFIRINHCELEPLVDMNGIKGASSDAGAEAEVEIGRASCRERV